MPVTAVGDCVCALGERRPGALASARLAIETVSVVLQGSVGVDGCVRELKVIRSLGYGLDESATYAVQRVKPFQEHGKHTVKNMVIEVNFDPLWCPDYAELPKERCGDNGG